MTDLKLPELPEAFRYPAGEVVGPCACGSWPGGTCFRCPAVNFYTAAQLTAYATAAVLAERAAAEADAKRYRWLRDSADARAFIACRFGGNKKDLRQMTGSIADAAIDAAMEKP